MPDTGEKEIAGVGVQDKRHTRSHYLLAAKILTPVHRR